MVEARLWRLVVEIEWLNCFPSVSLWANCMYSPIRSIYIRLFEPSDCIALLLTNVLTCNTVPFALYFSPLWSIQSCVMLFKEFIYPHNLSFEPISVPFISAWDCVLKLFTEKYEKEESGPAMMAAVPSWGLDVNCSGSWSEVEAALAAYILGFNDAVAYLQDLLLFWWSFLLAFKVPKILFAVDVYFKNNVFPRSSICSLRPRTGQDHVLSEYSNIRTAFSKRQTYSKWLFVKLEVEPSPRQ